MSWGVPTCDWQALCLRRLVQVKCRSSTMMFIINRSLKKRFSLSKVHPIRWFSSLSVFWLGVSLTMGCSPQPEFQGSVVKENLFVIAAAHVPISFMDTLIIQSSREDAVPVEASNQGMLHFTHSLGIRPLADAGIGISDVRCSTTLAVLRTRADQRSHLHKLDLANEPDTLVGSISNSEPLLGLTVES